MKPSNNIPHRKAGRKKPTLDQRHVSSSDHSAPYSALLAPLLLPCLLTKFIQLSSRRSFLYVFGRVSDTLVCQGNKGSRERGGGDGG
ncbi:unnamed protein product [Arctogadus glacialis]